MNDRLNADLLVDLSNGIKVPTYDWRSVSPGIVHLGVGAFHRAHQAVITDDRLEAGELEWGIMAASLRSPETRDALRPQDNLYTLAIRDGQGERLRVVGSILHTLVATENPSKLLYALCHKGVRIVTLTITEKGYTANIAERRLLRDHPDIVFDLENANTPRTVLGFLTEAIARRWAQGLKPFTLLSCDNLPSNGKTLHRILIEFAGLRSQALAKYIEENVACPSSMVDRIVPATTEEDRERISSAIGAVDAWPVLTEPFFQWVIEDNFPAGRPRWELSGAEFVDDVLPYEHMKLRMLNGSHTVIAAIGQIAGMETVMEAFANPSIRNFIGRYWAEVSETLHRDIDADAYCRRLTQRFDNPALRHRTVQIASDASQKIPQRTLEPLKEIRVANGTATCLTFAVAAWIRSCESEDENGKPLSVNDFAFKTWATRANPFCSKEPERVIERFLEFDAVFDADLRDDDLFKQELVAAYTKICALGIIAALDQY